MLAIKLNSASVKVSLFGPVTIKVDHVEHTTFRSHRVPALIGYLAKRGRMCRREEVAESLWPNSEIEQARHNLRQTLQYARLYVGDDAFVGSRHDIGISDQIEIDSKAFENHFDRGQLADYANALSLYRGPFLDGVFDEWAEDARLQYSRQYLEVLIALGEAELNTDPKLALQRAEAAISEDPFDERARAIKLRSLRRLDRPAAAQIEYDSFAEFLNLELRMSPSRIIEQAMHEDFVAKASTEKPRIGSEEFQSSCLALARGRKPSEGVELAIALVPHWCRVGFPGTGIEILEQTRAIAGENVDKALYSRSEIARGTLLVFSGRFKEGRIVIDAMMPQIETPVELVRANMLRATIEIGLFRPDRSIGFTSRAIETAKHIGLVDAIIEAQLQEAKAAFVSDNFDTCIEFLEKCLELAQTQHNFEIECESTLMLAYSFARKRLIDDALRAVDRIEPRISEIRTTRAIAMSVLAARVREELGDINGAESRYQQAAKAYKDRNDHMFQAVCLTYLGDLLETKGQSESAIAAHQQAIEIRTQNQDEIGIATSLRGIGRSCFSLERYDEASNALTESARLFRGAGATLGYASSLCVLGQIEAHVGSAPAAARMFRRALNSIDSIQPMNAYQIGPTGPALIEDSRRILREIEQIYVDDDVMSQRF